jgi:putative spermidine/putrescine transport system permease protein
VAWLLVIYIGSLILLGFSAFFTLDPVSQEPTTTFTFQNIVDAFTNRSSIRLFLETVVIAATVTLGCVALALPSAFFVAKIAPRWMRRAIIVSMLLPLWAGYMVKTYAWRAMVAPAGGNRFAAEGRGGGGFLESVLGWTPGYSRASVVIALIYLWFPYMVLPIYAGLERLPVSLLDASGDLGARTSRTFRSVVFPILRPALATGFALAFARAVGEYGSVVFISGNLPMRTEIAPLLIVTQLEQYDYAAATAIAAVLLVISFALLLAINAFQRWGMRQHAAMAIQEDPA